MVQQAAEGAGRAVPALDGSSAIPNKIPFLSRTGWALVAFLCLVPAFLYIDRPSSEYEVLSGVVTQAYFTSPRYGIDSKICRIRLPNQTYIEEHCAPAEIGARVNVCKRVRKLSGAPVYEVC
jgi:hypothetical protein